MKKVEVVIDENAGTVTIETKGYQGKACLEDTRPLEKSLGITKTTPTAEMYRTERQQVKR